MLSRWMAAGVVVVTLATVTALAAADTLSSGCLWAWRTHRDATGPVLEDVAVVSRSEAWAVGWTGRQRFGAGSRSAILRWDGRRWTPSRVPAGGQLLAVSAAGPNEVWAVGDLPGGSAEGSGLVLRWNGRAWRYVETPPESSSGFSAVAAVSATDVWVGRRNFGRGPGDEAPAFEHWDGRAWTSWLEDEIVTIEDFAVLSASDIWAVGERGAVSLSEVDPVVFHWDGLRWTEVPVATPAGFDDLRAVAARGDQVWAVGSTVQRWDGRGWRLHARTIWNDVVVADRGRVHTVGSRRRAGHERPLTAEWDGRSWTTTALAGRGVFEAVARVPGRGLVAVGGTRPERDGQATRTRIASFTCR